MLLVFQWHDVTCKNRTATGMKHCHHVDGSKNAKSKLLRTGTKSRKSSLLVFHAST